MLKEEKRREKQTHITTILRQPVIYRMRPLFKERPNEEAQKIAEINGHDSEDLLIDNSTQQQLHLEVEPATTAI